MQKPSGRNQPSIRGLEPKAGRDSSSATVSRDPPMTNQTKSTRKSSAEINRTVNAFVQQASKIAISGFPRNDGSGDKPKPHNIGKTTAKQILEMQGGYFKSRQPPSVSKTTSGTGQNRQDKTATVTFAKDAEPSGKLRRSDQSPTADFPPKKSSVQKAGKEVRMAGCVPSKGNRVDSDVTRSTGRGVNPNYSTTHRNTKSMTIKAAAQKTQQAPGSEFQALVRVNAQNERSGKTDGHSQRSSNRNRLDYYTTSSSDDECTRPPIGPNAPLSPASKAKMWNDINKSPGPTYPGWKFRSPPEGRHLSQLGAEELSAALKNMKMEAEAKTEEAITPKGPSKFSDYMRKMKAGSRAAEEMSEASLQQNIELKKMYAEQLDAMNERAWDSLQALDGNLKRNAQTESGLRTSFDKFMEGTSRTPSRLTVGELAKSRGGNFKGKDNLSMKPLKKSFAQGDVVQADDFSSDESDIMSPPSPRRSGQPSPRGKPRADISSSKPDKPTSRMEQMLADIRSTRRNLAQGDVLQDSDTVSSSADSGKMSKPSPRPRNLGRSGANAKTKPTPGFYCSPYPWLRAAMGSIRAPSTYRTVPTSYLATPSAHYGSTTPHYSATNSARTWGMGNPGRYTPASTWQYMANPGRYSYPRRRHYWDDDSDDDSNYYYHNDYDNDYVDLDIVDFD